MHFFFCPKTLIPVRTVQRRETEAGEQRNQTMNGSVLKMLLSSNHSASISRTLSSTALLPHLLQFGNRYSSIPRRPAGGGGDGGRGGDKSEEFFLRSLNFGDGGSGNGAEKETHTRQRTPGGGSRRPMRGGRGDDGGEDLFSRYGGGKNAGLQASSGGTSSGPTRGERRERAPLRQSFDLASHEESRVKLDSCNRSSKTQITNEPAGEEERDDPFIDFSSPKLELDDQFGIVGKGESSDQPETPVIHKMKFSAKEEEKSHQDASNQSLGDEHSLPESSIQDADAIFKKMKETGLIPNAVAMLDGLCKDGLVQEAMKLFGLMREKGTIPEVVIYTAVVEGFCKAAKYDDAKRIFRKMQKNGIVPNAFSYRVIIQGLCKGKRWEDCIEFCLEMLDSGHSPNVMTLTGLVDGICKENGLEEAEKVIKRLRERGLAVDEKAVRDHLDRRGPFSPLVWEAIFGKKSFQRVI